MNAAPLRSTDEAGFPPPGDNRTFRLASERPRSTPPLFDLMNAVFRHGHWARLKKERALRVLAVLFNRAHVRSCDVQGMKRSRLEDEAGVSPHTFIRALEDLEKAGLLQVDRRPGGKNTYHLLNPAAPADATTPIDPADPTPTDAPASPASGRARALPRPEGSDPPSCARQARTPGARPRGARHQSHLESSLAPPPNRPAGGEGGAQGGDAAGDDGPRHPRDRTLFDGLPEVCKPAARRLVAEFNVGWAAALETIRHYRPTLEEVENVIRSVRHMEAKGELRRPPVGMALHRIKTGEFKLHHEIQRGDDAARDQAEQAAAAQRRADEAAAIAAEQARREQAAEQRAKRERNRLAKLSNSRAKQLGRDALAHLEATGHFAAQISAVRQALIRGERTLATHKYLIEQLKREAKP